MIESFIESEQIIVSAWVPTRFLTRLPSCFAHGFSQLFISRYDCYLNAICFHQFINEHNPKYDSNLIVRHRYACIIIKLNRVPILEVLVTPSPDICVAYLQVIIIIVYTPTNIVGRISYLISICWLAFKCCSTPRKSTSAFISKTIIRIWRIALLILTVNRAELVKANTIVYQQQNQRQFHEFDTIAVGIHFWQNKYYIHYTHYQNLNLILYKYSNDI